MVSKSRIDACASMSSAAALSRAGVHADSVEAWVVGAIRRARLPALAVLALAPPPALAALVAAEDLAEASAVGAVEDLATVVALAAAVVAASAVPEALLHVLAAATEAAEVV